MNKNKNDNIIIISAILAPDNPFVQHIAHRANVGKETLRINKKIIKLLKNLNISLYNIIYKYDYKNQE